LNKIHIIEKLSLVLLISISLVSCDKEQECVSVFLFNNEICIDSTLINNSIYCIEIYEPVCGCDGNTYPNYCYAERLGVISYVSGECGNQ